MLINYDPKDYKVVSSRHTCAYHKKHPTHYAYPGCTCSGSYGLVKKTVKEKLK